VFSYNQDGLSRNLPIQFVNHQGEILEQLNEGHFYYSTHPGKPPFKIELGDEITNDDMVKTSPITFTDKFEITTETIDDTVALYADNGTRKRVDIKLTLQLDNLTSSSPSPIKTQVLPLTRQFIALLKPVDNQQPRQYGYSFTQQVIGPVIDDKVYDKHIKPISQNNNIEVVRKQLDDKTLLFARNGYKRAKTLTITLDVTNLRPSKSQQLTVKLPPLSEVYLQHLVLINTFDNSELGWALQWY
jgi:hypothetical protein